MDTGEKIRLLRKERKMTIEQLAVHLHMQKANLSKKERGDIGWKVHELEKIADVLKCPIAYLYNEPTAALSEHHMPFNPDALQRMMCKALCIAKEHIAVRKWKMSPAQESAFVMKIYDELLGMERDKYEYPLSKQVLDGLGLLAGYKHEEDN